MKLIIDDKMLELKVKDAVINLSITQRDNSLSVALSIKHVGKVRQFIETFIWSGK